MYHPFFQFVLPRIGQAAAGCAAVCKLFAAAALAAGQRMAGAVLRPSAAAYAAAGLHQPRPAGLGHRVHRAPGHFLLHGYRHRAAHAPGGWYAAIRLAHFLAGWHNTMVADGFHHVVGPPPRPETVYHKI